MRRISSVMDIKDLNISQLAKYIEAHSDSGLLVITQDRIFRDALNRILNGSLNKEKWVRRSADIMTLSQWYDKLWDKCRLRCILNDEEPLKIIDATSEIVLWRKLVADWTNKTEKPRPLINANGAADIMHKSWELLVKHNYIGCSHTAVFEAKDPQALYNEDKTGQCKTFLNCLRSGNAEDNGVLQPDHKALLEIAAEYSGYMDRHSAVSSLLIPNALVKMLSEKKLNITMPKEIVLANFSEPEPQILEFFKFLENRFGCGTTLYRYPDKADSECETLLLVKPVADNEVKSPFESLEEELVYAARRAQALAENPQNRAAVVIPQLRGSVSDMALILDKALAPEALIGGKENMKRPYSLISGEIIIKHPLIQDILNLLRLSMSTLSRQKLINIISDSFLKTHDKLSEKAALCRKLRRDFHSIYTLDDFSRAIEEYNTTHSSESHSAKTDRATESGDISNASDSEHKKHAPLAGLKTIADGISGLKNDLLKSSDGSVSDTDTADIKRSLSQWAEYASRLVNISFNRKKIYEHSKTSDNAIATLLKELGKLRRVSRRHYLEDINFHTFMQYVRLILLHRENKFYYRQDTESLRILTVNQALKSQFTHLYLIQFNDDNFPAPVSSQGFIPIKILDFMGYERANAKQALRAARRRLYGLTQTTERLCLSFSNTQYKNGALMASAVSPLWRSDPKHGWKVEKHAVEVKDVPTKESSDPGFICCSKENIWERTEEVKLPDARPNKSITVNEDTGEKVDGFKGGTGLINAMCSCPFRAFLTYRLRCEDDKPADEGLSNLDRGLIIHEIMENIWIKLEDMRQKLSPDKCSSDFLKSLIKSNEGEQDVNFDELLERIINHEIDESLRKVHADSPVFNKEGAVNLLKENERERLDLIIRSWLLLESKRSEKFKVDKNNLEKRIVFHVQSKDGQKCYFDGRADRIDSLIDNNGQEIGSEIIDYKSGKKPDSKKYWEIDEPNPDGYPLQDGKDYQLPIYASFSEISNCQQLNFGKLTLENSGFLTKPFDYDYKEKCISMITQRIDEFVSGREGELIPRANPTHDNCIYCHLKAVCPYKDPDAGEED